jgi:peptidoglycan/LPS O-acetylase OafA/YrhL
VKPYTLDVHHDHSGVRGVPTLDGLRAISIILVLACHLLPLGPHDLHLNAMAGPMGMSLFFTLSGYLIVRTLRSGTLLEFVVKRVTRILPLVYSYILFVFVVLGLSLGALFVHLGFILNYRLDQMIPVTEHLWSLCVEVHFYILITILAAIGGRGALKLVWPLCLAVTAMRVMDGAYIDVRTHLRIDEILAGACIATLPKRAFRTNAIALLAWMLAAAGWTASSHPDAGWLQYLRPYMAALLLLSTLSQPPNWLSARLSSRTLRYIAATSYALYVIHPLTAHGWWNEGNIWQRYLLKRPLGFAFTLVAAHMSTFYWERLWLTTAKRWLRSRRAEIRRPAPQAQNVAGQ